MVAMFPNLFWGRSLCSKWEVLTLKKLYRDTLRVVVRENRAKC